MIDAMKQALEALENGKRVRACEGGTKYQPELEDVAIVSLRQAIKAAENPDEPPDYVEPVTTDYHEGWEEGFKAGNALAPPKPWVGLTDDEIDHHAQQNSFTPHKAPSWFVEVCRDIEAKLKERNNG
jgi:hypothetical protein